MDALEAILSRRSIRKYAPEPVPDEIITGLLKAAMSAPSAGNEQPWQFIVLRDRAILDQVPVYHPHSGMIREVSAAILVCADMERDLRQGYWVQDCAAATENILLAARALGYGTVWLGVYPREERVAGLKKLLGLPETIVPFSLIPVGRPGEEKPPAERFDSSRVHFNGW